MSIRTIAAAIAILSSASIAHATTYDYQFTSSISSASTTGIAVGDTYTLDLYLDNGGSTNASQTWNGYQVVGFTAHAGSYTASYSTPFAPGIDFSFSTDGAGAVSQVTFYGTDPSSQNSDSFNAGFSGDYVFGNAFFNDSLGNGNSVAAEGFNDASAWQAVDTVPEPAPTMLMLGAFAAFAVTRRRSA